MQRKPVADLSRTMAFPNQAPYTLDNSSESTVSTNFTADGLAGPGRTLGMLYGYFGRKIENRLNYIVSKRVRVPKAAFDHPLERDLNVNEVDLTVAFPLPSPKFMHENSSQSSVSKNATADGLVGPGRLLGLFYQYLGRKIETGLSRIAVSSGLGPDAAYERIVTRVESEKTKIYYEYQETHRTDREIRHKAVHKTVEQLIEKREIVNDCLALLRYAE